MKLYCRKTQNYEFLRKIITIGFVSSRQLIGMINLTTLPVYAKSSLFNFFPFFSPSFPAPAICFSFLLTAELVSWQLLLSLPSTTTYFYIWGKAGLEFPSGMCGILFFDFPDSIRGHFLSFIFFSLTQSVLRTV